LDKDAILTITAAAVQQIDREFQEANQTIQTLKSKINELETRLVAMDARLSRAGF
jgi:type II secretory pathway component PulJ